MDKYFKLVVQTLTCFKIAPSLLPIDFTMIIFTVLSKKEIRLRGFRELDWLFPVNVYTSHVRQKAKFDNRKKNAQIINK